MEQKDAFQLLAAENAFPEYRDKVMLFGHLVGSWEMEAHWYDQEGGHHEGKGEWHFQWILGGRGVQDVLFAKDAPKDHYGTTLRCYDPKLDVWQVTWMQPYGDEFVNLIGREENGCIIQEGISSNPLRKERWSFMEITPERFLWLAKSQRMKDKPGFWNKK